MNQIRSDHEGIDHVSEICLCYPIKVGRKRFLIGVKDTSVYKTASIYWWFYANYINISVNLVDWIEHIWMIT